MGHILLIEPDRPLADMYRQVLAAEGHSVLMCASAQSAIFGADEQRPDLVILELQLIGHSGIEFLYEFRSYADWQVIPVIVNSHVPASEFSASWDFVRHELGIQAYHYKPLTSLRALLRTVNECVVLQQA